METLNMTWVNLLRMQFIEILEFYDENPERFNYKELIISCIYNLH